MFFGRKEIMNEAAIRRYERALGKSVRGIRLRKKVKEAFRDFLSEFRDEFDVQDYDMLLTAFGPPEQMAETLVQSLPELPKPMKRAQKALLVSGLCFVLVIMSIGGFLVWNQAETDLYFAEGSDYLLEEIITNYVFMADGLFGQKNIEWKQGRMFSSYILLLENTNQVCTKIDVRYSDYRPPHTFELSPGEQVMVSVNDARHSNHAISFDSPDGTFSGTVRVLAF